MLVFAITILLVTANAFQVISPKASEQIPLVSAVFTKVTEEATLAIQLGYLDVTQGHATLVSNFSGTDQNAYLGGLTAYAKEDSALYVPCVNGPDEQNAICVVYLANETVVHTSISFDDTHRINGLVFDYTTNVVYFVHTLRQGDNAAASFLGSFDVATGAVNTAIFPFTGYSVVDVTDNFAGRELFVITNSWSNASDTRIVTLDLDSLTVAANVSVPPSTQAAFYNSKRDTIFAAINGAMDTSYLGSINPKTGAVSKVLTFPAGQVVPGDCGIDGSASHFGPYIFIALTDRVTSYLTILDLDSSAIAQQTPYTQPFGGGLSFVFTNW